ncbi:alpha/beta fold hydrolase [Tundrisphaera lichenicola]|uniref:alpha/beta fold hydrolase n=1 Tax=Tundrisphaera lichenicola TaxID=2029860 RepID=UPI003EB9D8ED
MISLDSPEVRERLERAASWFLTPRRAESTRRDEEWIDRGTALDLVPGLAVTSWGEGPPVLLAHGWNSRGSHWGSFIEALTEVGFQALAIDAPGHGGSSGGRCNVLMYGLALIEIGRQVGPLAGVVAHSFGMGAAVIALHRGLIAERVVLMSGPSSLRCVVEEWGRRHGLVESELPAFVEVIEREVGEPIDPLDLARLAIDLRQPALIVHDLTDEDISPDHGRAVAAAWPGSKTLFTRKYGHRRILFARPVIEAVVSFLKGEPVERVA